MIAKVSVIVPIYNSATRLKSCLDSILSQTFQDFELILVDDCSSDQSLDICKKYAEKDKRIKVVHRKINGGVSAARNDGIKNASGEHISFIDSDDTVSCGFLENLLQLSEQKNADLVCCKYVNSKNRNFPIGIDSDKYAKLVLESRGFVWNKLYLQKIIKNNNLKFDTDITMGEDLLFNFEYLKYCRNVIYTDEPIYHYGVHQESASQKIRNGWFDLLSVYKMITKRLPAYPSIARETIYLNYMSILMEAKMRCRMMKLDFNKVCADRGINPAKILKDNYRKIMQSRGISHKDKLRLFVFRRFNFLSQLIKFRRVYAV